MLLQDAPTARYNWPLARVLEVYPDPKGIVRTAKVLCRGEEYLRPVARMVRLELDSEDASNQLQHLEETIEFDQTAGSIEESEEEEHLDANSSADTRSETEPEESGNINKSTREEVIVTRQPTAAARPVRRAALRQREGLTELIERDLV